MGKNHRNHWGIASGKSTVTNFLRKRLSSGGCRCSRPPTTKPGGRLFQLLVQHFGQEIILENGELNRPLLASLIFSNPEEREWSRKTKERLFVTNWLH